MTLMSILINYGFLVFGFDRLHGCEILCTLWRHRRRQPMQEREQDACRRIGLRLAEWVATYIDGRHECHPLKQTYGRFQDLGK